MNNENQTEQASISATGDMKDSIAVAGNNDIVNSIDGSTIIGDHNKITIISQKDKKPEPEKPGFLFPNYIIALLVFGLSGWWWFSTQDKLKPFEEKTYGIIVTTFKGNTDEQKNKGKEIQSAIQSTLNARFKELGINDADARNTSVLIESHEAAREYGKKYKAELVIWGDVTLQGIIPNITIVNEKSYASELMKPDTAILKDSLTHIALAKENNIRLPALTDEPTKLVSFVTALKYMEKGDREKAIEYFTYSIPEEHTKGIDSSVIFFYKGNIYYRMEEYDKSIVDHTQAIQINQKFAKAYINRGVTYGTKKEYNKAIEDSNQAININQKDTSAYVLRGIAYYFKDEDDKAIADFTKAIQINQKFDIYLPPS